MTDKEFRQKLASLETEDLLAMRADALAELDREKQRRDERRSTDPIGTIRFTPDAMWVRVDHRSWSPWPRDNHGLSQEDHELPWQDMPIVGMMPPDWVAEYERWAAEDDYDE